MRLLLVGVLLFLVSCNSKDGETPAYANPELNRKQSPEDDKSGTPKPPGKPDTLSCRFSYIEQGGIRLIERGTNQVPINYSSNRFEETIGGEFSYETSLSVVLIKYTVYKNTAREPKQKAVSFYIRHSYKGSAKPFEVMRGERLGLGWHRFDLFIGGQIYDDGPLRVPIDRVSVTCGLFSPSMPAN